MRPHQLTPLFAAAKSLAGIGPRMEILLRKALRLPPGVSEPRVIDLLWHTPTGVIDRRATPTVAEAVPGTIATLEVRVLKHKPAPRGNTRAPYKVTCEDDTGRIDLVFFHAERKFIERQLPTGSIRTVSGRIESYNDKKQMTHPDYIVAPEARADLPMLEPVYPLTAGLSGKVLLKAARQAIERVPELPEWQDAAWLEQRGWPDARTALARLHRPEEPSDVSPASPPWQRLAYDELLAGQLALALVRQSLKSQPGRSVDGRRPHPRPDRRRAALRPHRLAAPGLEGDRRGHGLPAPHAASAAGRRRLRQDGGGADGHGGRRGGGRAGRADGADRGAGAAACRDHRAARRCRRPALAPAHRAARRAAPAPSCWSGSRPATSTS